MSLEAVVGEGEGIGSIEDNDSDSNGHGGGGEGSSSGRSVSVFGGLQDGESKGGREGGGGGTSDGLSTEASAGAQGLGGNTTGRAQGGLSWVTRRDKSTTVSGQQSTRKPPRNHSVNQGGVSQGEVPGEGPGVDLMPPSLTSDDHDHLNASFETDYGSAWGDITQGNITPLGRVTSTSTSSSYDIGSPLSSPYSPSSSSGGDNNRGGNNREGNNARGQGYPQLSSNRHSLSPRDALYYSSDEEDNGVVGGGGRRNGNGNVSGGGIEGSGLLESDEIVSEDDDSVSSDPVLPEIFFGNRDRDSGRFNAKISFHSAEGGSGAVPAHPFDPHTNGGLSRTNSTSPPVMGVGVGGGGRGMPLADDDTNPSHQTIKPPRTGGKGDRLGGGRGKGRGFSLMALVFSPLQHLFHASAIAEGNITSGGS